MEILLHVSIAMVFHDPEILEYIFLGSKKNENFRKVGLSSVND